MKVSIITVTYNSCLTVEDTIQSVLAQTYPNIEYIVIDGNSTDGTRLLLERYRDKIARIISEPDKGIYDAMNKGINLATGDIIGILNSDDFFTSQDVVECIVRGFELNNIDALYGDVHFVESSDLCTCVRYYSSALFSPWLFRFGFMPAHPTFYVRRECYKKYGSYDLNYKIASDYELLVRFIHNYKIRTFYLRKDFVTMRMGGISTKNIRNRLLINKEDVKACRQNNLYTNLFFISFKYVYKIFELRWWRQLFK